MHKIHEQTKKKSINKNCQRRIGIRTLDFIRYTIQSSFVRTVFQQNLAGTVRTNMKGMFKEGLTEQVAIRVLVEHHGIVTLVVPMKSCQKFFFDIWTFNHDYLFLEKLCCLFNSFYNQQINISFKNDGHHCHRLGRMEFL